MPRLSAIRKQAIDGIMKEALFGATVAILGEQGVDGLTMERVAFKAGIAKGSLYRYFDSKRDLLEFVYTKLVDPIYQHLKDTVQEKKPAIEKLSGHLRILLEHVSKYGYVHELLFENDVSHGLLRMTERRSFEAARQEFAEIFGQGIEEGVFRPNDPSMLAAMYLSLCKAVVKTRPGLDQPDRIERIHDLILDTFLNGIATRKGTVC
jgi:AcrR family transcriptional regulator